MRDQLRDNRDVVTKSDKELGQINTVTMKTGTGDQPPIKLKPCRTPIHKIPLVEEVVKDMLKTEMIERSESPWIFTTVVVDKKMVGTGFA